MANTNRMAEEGRRLGEQVVEQAKRVGQATEDQMERGSEQFHDAARIGIDAANNSFLEVNRGFQAIVAEMTRYSQRSLEDVMQASQQLLSVRSFGDVVDIQMRYAQKAYDTHSTEISKLAALYREIMSNAARPIEQTVQGLRRRSER